MTNKTKHTPTPWDRMGDLIIRVEGPASFDVAKVDSEANAAHIVKCVNLHDELVDALKRAHQEWCELYAERYGEEPNETPYEEALKKAGAL